jgi:hypothetical protein
MGTAYGPMKPLALLGIAVAYDAGDGYDVELGLLCPFPGVTQFSRWEGPEADSRLR